MSARPKVPPIQLTMVELRWLYEHTRDVLTGYGYFYRGVTFRRNAAAIRDKVHEHLWPHPTPPEDRTHG